MSRTSLVMKCLPRVRFKPDFSRTAKTEGRYRSGRQRIYSVS